MEIDKQSYDNYFPATTCIKAIRERRPTPVIPVIIR